MHLERELLGLGRNFPPILIERLVATVEEMTSVWIMSVARGLVRPYETEEDSLSTLHFMALEPYTEFHHGHSITPGNEFVLRVPIDKQLLHSPIPFITNEELKGPLTNRELVEATSCNH